MRKIYRSIVSWWTLRRHLRKLQSLPYEPEFIWGTCKIDSVDGAAYYDYECSVGAAYTGKGMIDLTGNLEINNKNEHIR